MDYITMIFDMKDSRHLENRFEMQLKLIEAIKKCNEQFQNDIASSFIITIGDEWEGLLKPNANYESIIRYFHDALFPDISFYTGIGIGDITITDFELTVNQLDGPAFYYARDAINIAKHKNYRVVIIQE